MNSEAHKIVEEIAALDLTSKSGSVQASTETVSFIAVRVAQLHVILAEEQGKAALRMEEQTDRLIEQTNTLVRFTRGLYALTIALLVVGAIQLAALFLR